MNKYKVGDKVIVKQLMFIWNKGSLENLNLRARIIADDSSYRNRVQHVYDYLIRLERPCVDLPARNYSVLETHIRPDNRLVNYND